MAELPTEIWDSKGAIRMLTRTLALELTEHDINVSSLAPGMVLTPSNQPAIDDPKLLEEQVQSIPMKRAAQPGEIAKLAVLPRLQRRRLRHRRVVRHGRRPDDQPRSRSLSGVRRSRCNDGV